MAANTYRDLISIIQTLNRNVNSDKDINDAVAIYLIAMFVNKYKYTKLAKGGDYGKYLHIDPLMQVLVDAVTSRKYIELPENILNLPQSNGIDYVTYSLFDANKPPMFVGKTFFKTTPSRAEQLYYNPYTKPTLDNPYFYIVEDRCYLLGLEGVNINLLETGMFLAFKPFDALTDLDHDIDDFEIADYIVISSLDMVRYMLLIPPDKANDGSGVYSASSIPAKLLNQQGEQQQQQADNSQQQQAE